MPVSTKTWSEVLTARGFVLTKWRHQSFLHRVFGSKDEMRTFICGTVEGLIEYDTDAKTMNVVAIANNVVGNGQFVGVIERLEETAVALRLRLRVVQFHNRRLADWFERRPYWARGTTKQLGEYAEFRPLRPNVHSLPVAQCSEV